MLGNSLVRRPGPFHWLKAGLTILRNCHFSEYFERIYGLCNLGSYDSKHEVRRDLDDVGLDLAARVGDANDDVLPAAGDPGNIANATQGRAVQVDGIETRVESAFGFSA